jgi:beta-glucosidase
VVFIGPANDLGLQNGGWTVNWQGQRGDEYFTGADKKSSGANTLAQAVEKKLGNKVNYYFVTSPSQLPANLDAKSTIAIAVVAEMPYAEYMGDIGNSSVVDDWYQFGGTYGYNFYLGLPQSQYLGLMFNIDDTATVEKLHAEGIKLITVVYSGRPIIITGEGQNAPLENSDAVIAAFLPGTMGGKALAKAIFGDYQFHSQAQGQSNTLTFPWPRDMSDVESHFANGSLFPVGYGLAD